jgi:hypothetical protein
VRTPADEYVRLPMSRTKLRYIRKTDDGRFNVSLSFRYKKQEERRRINMSANFYRRLRDYYLKVGEVLRGDADAASIFPNPTDVGMSRERIYATFLRQHAPSKCNVFLGGFLFDLEGNESRQLDVIVTTDTAPRFNLHNSGDGGKAFSPVEGTLAVVSIKSTLDKTQLYDALDGLASIPPTQSLEGRLPPLARIINYDDWPFKVIYATNGLTTQTILGHLGEYYRQNPRVPLSRRPHLIHVAGKYTIYRGVPGMTFRDYATGLDVPLECGSFNAVLNDADLHGIVWVVNAIQQRALASTMILYNYNELINRLGEMAR